MSGLIIGRPAGSQATSWAVFWAWDFPSEGKWRFLPAPPSYRGHEEREMGFRHIVREEFPNLEVVELREMRDDQETAFSEATQLLQRHRDLAEFYNIGAGNEGIARALNANPGQRRIVYIAHELTAHNRARLLDGTLDAVIDQNPRVEAREALNILIQSVRDLPYDYHPPRLQIIFRENIPGNLTTARNERAALAWPAPGPRLPSGVRRVAGAPRKTFQIIWRLLACKAMMDV